MLRHHPFKGLVLLQVKPVDGPLNISFANILLDEKHVSRLGHLHKFSQLHFFDHVLIALILPRGVLLNLLGHVVLAIVQSADCLVNLVLAEVAA